MMGLKGHRIRCGLKGALPVLVAGSLFTGNGFSAQKHECRYCHVTFHETAQAQLNSPLSGLCLGCHPDRMSPNEHKVDIVPSMKVGGLPLSREDKITCVTCHDPHGTGGYPMLLRASPEALCFKCHFK